MKREAKTTLLYSSFIIKRGSVSSFIPYRKVHFNASGEIIFFKRLIFLRIILKTLSHQLENKIFTLTFALELIK